MASASSLISSERQIQRRCRRAGCCALLKGRIIVMTSIGGITSHTADRGCCHGLGMARTGLMQKLCQVPIMWTWSLGDSRFHLSRMSLACALICHRRNTGLPIEIDRGTAKQQSRVSPSDSLGFRASLRLRFFFPKAKEL
jgi:hypothetical protein